MTKETFQEYSQKNHFDTPYFFQYYCEVNTNDKFVFDLNTFNRHFIMYSSHVNMENIIKTIDTYYRNKFNLNPILTVLSKNGETLKRVV